MVHAGDEELIDCRLDLGEPHAKVLAEPGCGLRRHEAASGDVRGGRRPLEPLNLGAFGLGHVAGGVQVEDARGRSVRLVAHLTSVASRPRCPFGRERVEQQVRDRFPIVRQHARADVVGALAEELWQVLPQIVAAALLELLEHARRPVRLPRRIVDLVGIVEERAESVQAVPLESAIERQQVLPDCVRRKMIDDIPFAAGGCALDELAMPSGEDRIERPPARRCNPVQAAVRLNPRGQIQSVARVGVGHQQRERQVARILHLLERQRLQIAVGRHRLDQIGNLNGARFGPNHRRLRRGATRWISGRAFVDDVNLVADGADERCLTQRDGLGQTLAAGERPRFVDERPRRRVVTDPRSTEWPARSGRHVHAQLQAGRLAQRVVEHRHPPRRQIRDEAVFRAANAVDWRDLDAADSGRRERLQLRAEGTLLDRAALPPPPRPRPGLGGNRRPSAHLVLLCRRVRQVHEGWRGDEHKQGAGEPGWTRLAEFEDVIDVNDSQTRCCCRQCHALSKGHLDDRRMITTMDGS